MPIDNSCRFRFMNANTLGGNVPSLTYSSEVSGSEFNNALNSDRTDYWRPDSYFLIDATNNLLYINDGTDKTITIASGEYTGASLANTIQGIMNSSSSGWTISYTATYTFNFSRTSSATIQLSNQTTAIWETLGFSSTTDITSDNITANEQRNHWPYQWVKADFGYQSEVGFLAIIGALPSDSPISETGVVTIEANNIDDFSSPALSINAEISPRGVFKFIDSVDSAYRYWRVKIYDPYNENGPSPYIGQLYLGEYEVYADRSVSRGFSSSTEDQNGS